VRPDTGYTTEYIKYEINKMVSRKISFNSFCHFVVFKELTFFLILQTYEFSGCDSTGKFVLENYNTYNGCVRTVYNRVG
jgi:hypothetical protein